MWISLKLSKFLVDLLEYNASLIWNLVSFGSIMFALPRTSIKLAVPDMILTLTFVNVKSRKYLLSPRIMCGCTVSKTYTTLIHLEINNTWISDKTNKTIDNINSNVMDVITK